MTAEVRAWVRVVTLADCFPCEGCDEPVCPSCGYHYAECPCPGPAQDEQFEYRFQGEDLYARAKS